MLTTTEKRNGRVIVTVHEDIVDMKAGEAFKAALNEVYNSGEKELVLDLSGIRLISSHGIGKILMFYKRFKEAGGNIYITPMTGSIQEIFESLMLDRLLPTVEI